MSDWSSSTTTDRIVKLGKAWVRVSAVTAVEPASATEGSLVHCGTDYVRITSMTPDQIVKALWTESADA